MLRIARWSVPLALVLLLGCQDTPVAPEPDFGKGAGTAPNPEIALYDATKSGLFLYVMNADGSARTSIAKAANGASQFTWSRYGAGTQAEPYRGAYSNNLMGDVHRCVLSFVDIWVSGITVASASREVPTRYSACYLAWSPTGARLAYTTGSYDGSVAGRREIWIIDADGSNERFLYGGSRVLRTLDWSRDETHLVVEEAADDYTVDGDRLLLIDAANGAASTLFQSGVNFTLGSVDVGNTSNDVLFTMGTWSCCVQKALYRLPVGADYVAGTPQRLLEAGSSSWSPDDTRAVVTLTGGLNVYTLATGAKTSIGKGGGPHWRPQ